MTTPSLPPYFNVGKRSALVCSVYDGDTFTAVVEIESIQYRFPCRVYGVDTAEIRGTTGAIKDLAIAARGFVRALCLAQIVTIEHVPNERDKYGRQLVTVTLDDGRDLATLLLDAGLAHPYSGGRKRSGDDWESLASSYVPRPVPVRRQVVTSIRPRCVML